MTTPISIQGIRGTGDWGADERPKDFREMILWLNPNGTTPLTALLGKLKSEGLSDPEFSWWEEEQQVPRLKVSALADNDDNTLTVVAGGTADSTGAYSLVAGDLLMVETGTGIVTGTEVLKVVSVASDTSLVVERGVAGTTGAPIAIGSFLLKMGNAFAEGTRSPDANTRNPVKHKNYAQIFKTAYELTNTADKTKTRTGSALENDKKRKSFDHSTTLEQAYLFGRAFETTGTNGKPLRFTGGVFQYLQNQTKVFGGGLAWTEDNFIESISDCFNYTADGVGNERVVLAGNGALTELNKLARDSSSTRVNFDGTVKTYGMELQRWILPQGVIYIRTHPLFNVHPRYKYAMLGLNMSGLRDRYMRKHTFQDNIQENDADTRKGQWIGETGLELNHTKTHFVLLNCGNKLS